MSKDEQYALAKAQILDNISSWANLYEFFDELMARTNGSMHPGLVFDTLYTLYAFMHALRELPEEGDIKVLVEKMLRILVYEGKEKLGVEVTIMTVEEVRAVISQAEQQAVAMAAAERADGACPGGKPRLLH
jgi:hypothetical protein